MLPLQSSAQREGSTSSDQSFHEAIGDTSTYRSIVFQPTTATSSSSLISEQTRGMTCVGALSSMTNVAPENQESGSASAITAQHLTRSGSVNSIRSDEFYDALEPPETDFMLPETYFMLMEPLNRMSITDQDPANSLAAELMQGQALVEWDIAKITPDQMNQLSPYAVPHALAQVIATQIGPQGQGVTPEQFSTLCE